MNDKESVPIMSVSGFSSPPAWRSLRGSQNPVTPSNTPVISGVFAKNPSNPPQMGSPRIALPKTSADEIAEKLKNLGQ